MFAMMFLTVFSTNIFHLIQLTQLNYIIGTWIQLPHDFLASELARSLHTILQKHVPCSLLGAQRFLIIQD